MTDFAWEMSINDEGRNVSGNDRFWNDDPGNSRPGSYVVAVIDECMDDGWLGAEQGGWDEEVMLEAYVAAAGHGDDL